MTRGRLPQKALDDALPLAKRRGAVFHFRQEEACVADLVIVSAARIIFVRVKRTRRLYCSVGEIEEQYRESIMLFRTLPPLGSLFRELWIWSTYGKWRFFRVEETGLAEIDSNGQPVDDREPELNESTTPVSLESKGESVTG
jgi:hypothetical protein